MAARRQTLTWLVGPARARDVILTGRRLSPTEAEAWGVVARVVEAGRARDEAVALAASIAEGAPLGIRQAKAAIRGAHRALADGLAAENELYETVLVSEDRREGFPGVHREAQAALHGSVSLWHDVTTPTPRRVVVHSPRPLDEAVRIIEDLLSGGGGAIRRVRHRASQLVDGSVDGLAVLLHRRARLAPVRRGAVAGVAVARVRRVRSKRNRTAAS